MISYFQHVVRHKAKKGIKLDFKDIRVVEGSMKTVEDLRERLFHIPLWLNADILPGPGKTAHSIDPIPVDARRFLRLCNEYLPTKTLSLGWTTSADGGDYTALHVDAMLAALRESGVMKAGTRVTFPLRAVLLREEATAQNIVRLLDAGGDKGRYTATIWSAVSDAADGVEVAKFIEKIGSHRVYQDVPPDLRRSVENALH
jgi:hypothetical protein